MLKEFSRSGIHFQYPAHWELEKEDADNGWVVSLASSDTAFMVFSYDEGDRTPATMVDETLEAMKNSYPDLEAENVVETIAGTPAIGHDIQFFAMDLTNTCWSRSLETPRGCVLILSQCCDDELESNGIVMKAISASLTFDVDD